LIFNWSLRLLPIGLGCILAGQLANLSLDVFRALVTFIGLFYVTAFFLGCLYSLVLWYSLGGGYVLRGLKALSKPLLLAYTVDSSLVALSACLEILEQDLHVDKRIAGPLVDRIQSTMTVLANCTLVALVAKPRPRATSAMAVANPLRKTAEPETH
jgi:Na+/H+-dicarboxylate symporter